MSPFRFKSRLLRIFLVGLAALLVVVTVIFVRRPWALTVIREGQPDKTWPASGNFSQQGDVDTAAAPLGQGSQLSLTSDFSDDFSESGGSAFLLVTEGKIVASHYAEGYSSETKFNSFSMVKSLVGVLTLKAISDGEIESLDSTVGELWPKTQESEIAEIPLRNLLDMTSGIAFEKEPRDVGNAQADKKGAAVANGPFSRFAHLHADGVESVLPDVRLIEADVGEYSYQNLNTAILGRVLEEVYGASLEVLLEQKVATPADAGGFYWRQYSTSERISPYCCLYATTEWWAKVALFLMNNGHESQFLSGRWFDYFMGGDVKESERKDGAYRSQIRYDVLDRDGERLQGPFMFFTGLGGQMTYFVPEGNLIAIRFGQQYQPLHSTLYEASKSE